MDETPKTAEPGSRLPAMRHPAPPPGLDGYAIACLAAFVFGLACALLLAVAPFERLS